MIRPHSSYGNRSASPSFQRLLPAVAATERRRSSASASSASKKKHGPDVLLPEDFQPNEYTVIVGRGKKIRETTGNRRLRVLASSMLPQYEEAADADDRAAKTRLVNTVVDLIERACRESDSGKNSNNNIDFDDDSTVAFVRQGKDDGRWYEVDDSVAREKVGYVFRDLLAYRYESSSKSKVAKKMQLQRQREREQHEREEQERVMVDALHLQRERELEQREREQLRREREREPHEREDRVMVDALQNLQRERERERRERERELEQHEREERIMVDALHLQRERERERRERELEQHEREERIMVDALLELTATRPSGTVSERNDDSNPVSPLPVARGNASFENDLLNSPIIECLPME